MCACVWVFVLCFAVELHVVLSWVCVVVNLLQPVMRFFFFPPFSFSPSPQVLCFAAGVFMRNVIGFPLFDQRSPCFFCCLCLMFHQSYLFTYLFLLSRPHTQRVWFVRSVRFGSIPIIFLHIGQNVRNESCLF